MEKKEMYDHTISALAADVPDLTEEERYQLEVVMKKAKEFDAEEENKTKKPIEGQLFKYTNVVKGWQFRWFVLTPEAGMLEYYMPDETKKAKPRGGLHLAGAVVLPSEEDSFSFTITSFSGEVYKLKAANVNDRQFWVNRLHTTIEQHSKSLAHWPPTANKIRRSHSYSQKDFATNNDDTLKTSAVRDKKSPLTKTTSHSVVNLPDESNSSASDSLTVIRSCLDKGAMLQKNLANMIEALPLEGKSLRCSDTSLLLLKATSKAAIESLDDCYHILRQQQLNFVHPKGLPPGATVEWVDKKTQENE